jgi:hypothetical protein
MAVSFICDGCGCSVAKPKWIGTVIVRDYCEACAKNAEAFLAEEEENRANYRQSFAEARRQLISAYGKEGRFRLPDVA